MFLTRQANQAFLYPSAGKFGVLNAMVREIFVKIGRRNGGQLLSKATATPRGHATMLTAMVSKLIASPRFHSIEFPRFCSSNYSTFIGSNCSKFDCLLLCLTSNSVSATRQSLPYMLLYACHPTHHLLVVQMRNHRTKF